MLQYYAAVRSMHIIEWDLIVQPLHTRLFKFVADHIANYQCGLKTKVYSLGTQSWRLISSHRQFPFTIYIDLCVSAYGDMHWILLHRPPLFILINCKDFCNSSIQLMSSIT